MVSRMKRSEWFDDPNPNELTDEQLGITPRPGASSVYSLIYAIIICAAVAALVLVLHPA